MKKGLQSADKLNYDIKRMETSYLDKNKRDYEITKQVSLAQLDPLALVRLRATGICDFEIPEVLYDMDHPGQYFRRIKSVSVSLPCIAGPYTSVSAKLSMVNNRYRKNAADPSNCAEKIDTGDSRFVYNVGAIQSIATSNAQNDSAVFELNFRNERYLQFENTGAISSWRLELPTEVKQFDYHTISDVIVHVRYTAREGGSVLKIEDINSISKQLKSIKQGLNKDGLHLVINLKHDMPNQWHLLKQNGNVDIMLDKSRLPYMVQGLDITEIEMMIIAKSAGDSDLSFQIDDSETNLVFNKDTQLHIGNATGIEFGKNFELTVPEGSTES